MAIAIKVVIIENISFENSRYNQIIVKYMIKMSKINITTIISINMIQILYNMNTLSFILLDSFTYSYLIYIR